MSKKQTTVKISNDQRDLLKIIASLEKRNIQDIIASLVEDYIQRHKETLEILSNPEWVKMIQEGKEEVIGGIKGKSLDELED